ncbi:ABC transporter ATP-binding protein [Sulfurimonas sp. SAG-AH-194-L11]|nr:ABC transporter ATP-binding protein [Sulfurimonas sp. SAG-AH-194-L11]MDF1876706.1 ABC transporter ATP-binding protein [Sulfurimonas sp. SAG-AH-194-L11]
MNITSLIYGNLKDIIVDDKKNILYLLYYSTVEAILLMVSPLTSAFIINSVLAHATISITVLSIIVIVVFLMIAVLQVIKVYIVEKFEQKIFIKNAIKTSKLALDVHSEKENKYINKYMNYFFDVISIQKLFPILLITGSGLVIKVIVSLVLLLIFDINFFILGLVFIFCFSVIVIYLGRSGPKFAIERSNAKHETIFFIQNILLHKRSKDETLQELDLLLIDFLAARNNMFRVIVKQLSISFFIEGLILASFFILGGYLVFKGMIPIGEFVAIEIIIISVVYALRDFMKQIDYIYDMIEGFYKVDKLSKTLESKEYE